MANELIINQKLEKQRINEIFAERKNIPDDDKEAQNALLNRVVGELVMNARFVAPAAIEDKEDNAKEVTFHLIKSAEGEKYFPLFTSSEDLELWEAMKDKDTVQLGFDEYANLLNGTNECRGIVVNPLSDNFKADKGLVAQWFQQKQLMKQGHANHAITPNTKYEFYAPSPYPFQLADKLTETAKDIAGISRLWLRGVKLDGVDGYLAVVEFTGDRNEILLPLGESSKPYLGGKQIHFVAYAPGFGEEAVRNVLPIYAAK